MNKNQNKTYDLDDRTLEFAQKAVRICRKTFKDVVSTKIIDQLVRAAGSVGANYREASEALSKKDFIHRIKISRKECKESGYWFELLKEVNHIDVDEINLLIRESKELRSIFSSIIQKSI